MSIFLSFCLQLIVSLVISVAIWMILFIALLSGPIDFVFEHFLGNFFEVAKWGCIFGLSHGFITALIISWYKVDSVIGLGFSSVLSSEVLVGVGLIAGLIVFYGNSPTPSGNASPTTWDISLLEDIAMVIALYLILSIIFLIPAIIIGIANKPFVNLYSKAH